MSDDSMRALSRKYAVGEGLPDPKLLTLNIYADTVSREMFPQERDNPKRDAARHLLASALAAQKTSPGVAEFLGKAHEFKESPLRTAGHWLGVSAPRADYPTDVHNNALGVALGRANPGLRDLLSAVENEVSRGLPVEKPGRVSLRPDTEIRYAAGGEVDAEGPVQMNPAKIQALIDSLHEEPANG